MYAARGGGGAPCSDSRIGTATHAGSRTPSCPNALLPHAYASPCAVHSATWLGPGGAGRERARTSWRAGRDGRTRGHERRALALQPLHAARGGGNGNAAHGRGRVARAGGGGRYCCCSGLREAAASFSRLLLWLLRLLLLVLHD